MPTLKHCEAI